MSSRKAIQWVKGGFPFLYSVYVKIRYKVPKKLRSEIYRLIPDKTYVKMQYKRKVGVRLNLDNPQTFNEKLQWLKLYDRRLEYTMKVDKYAVRQFISSTIGEQYLIPMVGGPWATFDEIDFNKLPDQFVLKCTHDSGSIVICRDKSTFDFEAARAKLTRALK
jgi:hypothetical protein